MRPRLCLLEIAKGDKDMNLQVLVSTMYQADHSLIKKMNIKTDAIVINQCNTNIVQNIDIENLHVKWIDSKDRGLSKSRNMALEHVNCDVCLLADDDLEYLLNYDETVLTQFHRYPDADIIAFQIGGIEKTYKNYYQRSRKINIFTSMKISSVEIALRVDSIKKANIKFNEIFGAGAKYFLGEESIFLSECLKRGLIIMYVPVKIADLHLGNSTWFKGFNKEYFCSKGAALTAISKRFSIFLIIQFAIRKNVQYKNTTKLRKAISYMLDGRKQYLKESVR